VRLKELHCKPIGSATVFFTNGFITASTNPDYRGGRPLNRIRSRHGENLRDVRRSNRPRHIEPGDPMPKRVIELIDVQYVVGGAESDISPNAAEHAWDDERTSIRQ